ncbi:MAG: 8-oxo-dGTP diphosphatase [Clostridia bacterium]|nr:8-oxo-dGTP diphosphatase [Clostridia bacterium]
MARRETCILTNMCMICDGDKVLVQDRQNPDWPGITFPGGHVEEKESFVSSVIREVKEETGLDIDAVRLCGVKQWSHKRGEYRYIVFLYKTDCFSGKLRDSEEGKVFWIPLDQMGNYPLVDGFDQMLPVFLQEELTENYHWYEQGEWRCENR